MFTLTITKENGRESGGISAFAGERITRLRPSVAGSTTSAAIFEYETENGIVSYQVSETYAAVLSSATADAAANGAELLANKATSFATINDTRYPTTEAAVEVFSPIGFATTTGTNTYVATLGGVVPTAYYTGMRVRLSITNDNTAASTINLNGLGAKAIKKGATAGAIDVVAGDLASGVIYDFIYDGTQFMVKIDGTHNQFAQATDSGTDAFVVTLNYPAAYTGRLFGVIFATSNSTTAPTLNINGLGAKALKKGVDGATALSISDLVVGKIYTCSFDATNIQITNLI